jgi:uncharacterized protein
MSDNKKTVEQYMDGFRTSDHEQILACLTDDVEWILPGAFHLHGKEAFDKEIENDAFVGRPVIDIYRMIEDGDVVVVEGSVRAQPRDGAPLVLAMCDVFDMRDHKIKRLTSYILAVG